MSSSPSGGLEKDFPRFRCIGPVVLRAFSVFLCLKPPSQETDMSEMVNILSKNNDSKKMETST